VLKDDINNRHFTGKILTSPGIGARYFERDDWKNCKYKENGETNEMYRFRNGTKCALPRYFFVFINCCKTISYFYSSISELSVLEF
jgi:hypothetical protein